MSEIEKNGAEKAEGNEKRQVERKYWVAVNRDSAAVSSIPWPSYPTVMPTPQLLIGWDTPEEQRKCQRFLLTGRLDKVRRFVDATLPKLAREGKAVLKRFNCPGKPTRGETVWIYEGGEE